MIVDGNNLKMTRGDSESISVSYDTPFTEGDVIEMTVRQRETAPVKLIHKVITEFEEDGSALIVLNPEDTASMRFGDYVYDIQWKKANGWTSTIIKPAMFTLTSEVSYD